MLVPPVPAVDAPAVADHALIAFMVLVPFVEAWWYWPRILRALADRVPGTRRRAHLNLIVFEWALAAAVVALWVAQHRAWALLHVGAIRPLPTVLGAVFVAGYLGFMLAQVRKLAFDPERLVRFATQQAKTDPLAARTSEEQRTFTVLSVSAGLCEELFFRGFALWYFTSLTGPVAGFALAAGLFGLSHVYLGLMHGVRGTIVGAVFGLLVIGTGSLWLAIVLHMGMDLIGGELARRAFRAAEERAGPEATAGA